MVATNARRGIAAVIAPPPGHWVGDGFAVRTMLSYAEDPQDYSPFILLDYGAPRTFAPTKCWRSTATSTR